VWTLASLVDTPHTDLPLQNNLVFIEQIFCGFHEQKVQSVWGNKEAI
jgi:hypothetical protein